MNDCYLNFLVSFRALFSLDVGANLVNSKQTIGIILPDLSLLGYAVPVESFGIGLFVILFAYLIIEYNVQLLSHEKFKIAMNMLHTAHTPLILLRNQLEELKTGNLPEPLSQQVEEALGYAECIIYCNRNIATLNKVNKRIPPKTSTVNLELSTYVTSIVNQCRAHANSRQIRLTVGECSDCVSCRINENIMTAALQHLINKMILISESGCCISINVTHTMNSWQLQISNNEIAGQRAGKMFPFIPIIFPVYGYSDLWTVRKIIRLHGGKITGCRHGKAATFQIVIPTDCHCQNQSCPVLKHSSAKTKTQIDDSCESPYGCWAQFSGDGEWAQSNNHVQPRSIFYAQLGERLNKECAERARILPRNTSATSSPTVEVAMELAKEAYKPRLTLEHWIGDNKFAPSVASAGVKSIDDIKEKKSAALANSSSTAAKLLTQPEVTVTNGRIQMDGALLVGGSHTTPWWNGKLKTNYLKKASPAITRFVPGREGLGLTDRIDSVVDFMKQKNILVFDQNYGLWYDRRRDDHERVRRRDGDVWGPFYEQPFGRSGQGTAWEGLSKYDLKRPNAWYWSRLKEFAEKGNKDGLLLFHENYFQHNILEAGAHWVDSPWRSSNNINQTGFPEPAPFAGDKRIFVADMFYDITHPVRRELHRQYIRQCLNNFADNSNVIQLTSAEFTGPLHFVQFWLDVIAEWETETGKKVKVALSTTKDVQDAILADPKRAAVVDIIDIRYWHYKTDGIFAPEGGKNMAPRQHMRKMKVGKVTFTEAYKAVNEYRQKFPQKAVTFYAQNYPAMGWAVFMAGGSCPVIPCTDKAFLKDAAAMEVEETNTDEYKKNGKI